MTFSGRGRKAPTRFEFTKLLKKMEETKSKRGGRREGAGRKPSGIAKANVTLSFSLEILEFLRTKGRGQSAYIERLIREDQAKNS